MKIKENKFKYIIKKIFLVVSPLIIFSFLYFFFQNYNFEYKNINKSKQLSLLMNENKSEKIMGRKVQVMILNGCGDKGVAQLYTNFLRNNGYDVIDYDNAKHFDFKNTKIKIHNKKHENFETEIINLLSLKPNKIEYNYSKNIFYDMTLIIGDDFKELSSYNQVLKHYEPF